MGYYVTRQASAYADPDNPFHVEIAHGIDNVSPGALVAKYPGEFDEIEDPREAVNLATRIATEWLREDNPDALGRYPVTPYTAASAGLYSTAEDGMPDEDLLAWAEKSWEDIPKCERCGEPGVEYEDEFGEQRIFCGQFCAEEVYTSELREREADDRWLNDSIQFPRLLSEIRAVGLTDEQYRDLEASMDLTRDLVDELLERAETEWQRLKEEV